MSKNRHLIWAIIVFLFALGLELSGYTNMPLAIIIWSIAAVLFAVWLWNSLPEKPFQRKFMAPLILIGFGIVCVIGGVIWYYVISDKALSRELQYGLSAIYQEDNELTFKEIADRWEKSDPNDSYKAKDILQWLIGDMWLGKFEDEEGNSVLQFIPGFTAIDNGVNRTYLRKQLASLNRHRAFCLFARDSRLFDEVFMGQHQEMKQDGCEDWQTVKALAPWDILSTIEPRLYDDPKSNSPVRRDHFRRTVLEGAILNKEDFANWLRNTKRKTPSAWSMEP